MKRSLLIVLTILILTTACRFTRGLGPASTPKATSTLEAVSPTPRPTLESAEPILNIRYSDEASQRPDALSLDVYPASETNLPVVIFIHGGGWFRGDKSNVDAKPAAFNARGYVFVSVNYRLIPEVKVTDQMRDITRAVAWVKKNIAQYGGDPSRLFLMGHSAGAHMVALLGTDESYLHSVGLALTDLRGVIALDTQTYDLVRLLTNMPQEVGGEVYWETFGHDPEFWKKMSPQTYVAAGKDIPPFFIVYTGEKQSRAVISTLFFNALQEAGVPSVLLPATEKTHGQLNTEFGLLNDRISPVVFDWLGELLR
jgi:acetyl esterase/lipase